jgi:hypothetical protein
MKNHKPRVLSVRATDEFKRLFEEEFGECLSDDEAHQSAENLLHLFGLLVRDNSAPVRQIQVTENEWKALRYIHDALFHQNAQPTVRGIAAAIGRSSSRSGLRMLKHLISRGFVWRDDAGKIVMQESVAGCDTQLRI